MSDLKKLQQMVVEFRDARDWKQYHNPKDMAISLVLEAAELLEHFQWKNQEEMEQHLADKRAEVADEVVDVLYWVLLMAHDLGIDIVGEFERKMAHNAQKYPVDKVRGKHSKYTEL